jgi:hypothetical protein
MAAGRPSACRHRAPAARVAGAWAPGQLLDGAGVGESVASDGDGVGEAELSLGDGVGDGVLVDGLLVGEGLADGDGAGLVA